MKPVKQILPRVIQQMIKTNLAQTEQTDLTPPQPDKVGKVGKIGKECLKNLTHFILALSSNQHLNIHFYWVKSKSWNSIFLAVIKPAFAKLLFLIQYRLVPFSSFWNRNTYPVFPFFAKKKPTSYSRPKEQPNDVVLTQKALPPTHQMAKLEYNKTRHKKYQTPVRLSFCNSGKIKPSILNLQSSCPEKLEALSHLLNFSRRDARIKFFPL